ncbi:DinB family protein [Mumia zhuanghuii]|uniref:DinB family protein n=2 Tax=Mumia TaxID=1546255 RepID=A0ABW1QNS9_9ACTN|nr:MULTISPECIES: DinB family protein [Mumia]KAA1423882.1 DinB family protein [Mumia zhuanghuii]
MSERQFPDMWVDPEDDPRDTDAVLVGERATLIDYLGTYRTTLRMKCDGLNAEQMARRSVPPSTLSLLGLVRHLADVERTWFRQVMAGEDAPRHYRTAEDRDADFNGAVGDDAVVADAWRRWEDEVAYAERFVDDADDLGMMARNLDRGEIALREVLVHMIEEYSRHVGHADLLRECIDGRTGQ